jgi:restriction system protein
LEWLPLTRSATVLSQLVGDCAIRRAISSTLLGSDLYRTNSVESGLLGPDGRPLSLESRAGQQVLADVRTISDQMIVALQNEPELLFKLDPRRFEELIAELISRMGYNVELTPATRDGGKYIYATRRDGLATVLLLVEAKRYAPRRLVGIEIVQRLHGVVFAESATAGIVVTTSGFTAPARTFQQRDNVRRQLSLRDYRDLQDCLADARKGNPAARKI